MTLFWLAVVAAAAFLAGVAVTLHRLSPPVVDRRQVDHLARMNRRRP